MSDNELKIEISADSSKAKNALQEVQHSTENLNENLGSLALAATEMFAAFEGIAKPIEAFGNEERAVNSLTLALKNQGIYSEELAESYERQSRAISESTGINQAAIIQGQANLQMLIGQKEITPELTKAIVDYAARWKLDMGSAFDAVGKAAFNSTEKLKLHGIVINESLGYNERLAEFIKQSKEQFDGQAESAAKGVGSLKLLSNAFEALQVSIGSKFAPVVSEAAKIMADFIVSLSKNDAFVKAATAALALGSVLTAMAGLAKLATVAMIAFNVSVAALTGPVGLALAGIAAIGGAIAYWTSQNKTASGSLGKLNFDIAETEKRIANLKKAANDPIRNFLGLNDSKALDKEQAKLAELLKQREGFNQKSEELAAAHDASEKKREDDQKTRANAAQAERIARQNRRLAAEAAARDVLIAEANNESKEMIAIKKQEAETLSKIENDKYAKIRGQLQKHLADLKKLETAQRKTDANAHKQFNSDILKNDKEFQSMTLDQQKLFLMKHRSQLEGEIDDEQSALDKAAMARAQTQIQSNNQYLQDEIKYGTAYATINQAMHSAVYEGTKQAFGEMQQMQTSHNATLKAIGKVAAVANIIVSTAQSAMNIFQGFSSIPIVGYALGIAGAAAAIAFGAEKLSQVNSANKGGMIPGGGPDQDSVLSFLTPGEFVTPRSNYDETVNAVADARNNAKSGGSPAASGGQDNSQVVALLQQILAKVGDPPQVTISKSGGGSEDPFWDYAIRKISARVQFGNGRLITQPAGV